MQRAEKRRPRRIALWAGIVAKPRRGPSTRKGVRVVRWIGARSRRQQTPRAQIGPPATDGDNVVALTWSETFGRSDGPSLFQRLGVAPVLAFPARTMAEAVMR
ncbi:hypothetical protein [Methylobacterium aerolatum]|uniref:Uncharacterized protein n=1 Tax=Methylobacterium aerolatum TaxID=418708 RepID=A0ABU0HY56_9HYPH|nr:hypothetical protein [Methylobacterium aerolatum]MDQ0447274.1 hypothetical protein [Methylobacterium aerolatum]GJD36942.1 hypothetical protein FMGBMHLM_3867 [Methylobacterium aerolatum]